MSDEKCLLEEEEEERKVVELLKNESSTMEGEQMAEEKSTVEKSDRCELISLYITHHCYISDGDALTLHLDGQSCAQPGVQEQTLCTRVQFLLGFLICLGAM